MPATHRAVYARTNPLPRTRMPRFILLNSHDGSVHGDTARHGAEGDVSSATDAAFLLDRKAGRAPRGFGTVRKGSRDATLDAYRIDAAPGQPGPDDAGALETVRAHGTYVTSLIGYNS